MGDASISRQFGENLRSVRRRLGVSQEELGFRSGLHRTEVGLLERGERTPRLDTVIKLAGALGVEFQSPLLVGMGWTPATVQQVKPGSFSAVGPREAGGGEASQEI